MERCPDQLDAATTAQADEVANAVAAARAIAGVLELPRTGLCHYCGQPVRHALAVYCADTDCKDLAARASLRRWRL